MLFDNHWSGIGNVTADPELRYTEAGLAVCTFGIAQNDRKKDGTEEAHFHNIVACGQIGENAANTLSKGDRCAVQGTIRQSRWEDKETGQKRSRHEIVADDLAVSLRWCTATIVRNPKAESARPDADAVAASAGVDTQPF